MLIALVAVRLVLGAVPAADNPDLKKALQAYDSLDYDQALSILDRVVNSPDLSPADKVTAALYDGIVAFDLGKQDQAHDSLLKAAKANASVTLPDDAPPKLQEFFVKVKAEAAAAPKETTAAKPPDLTPHPNPTDHGADITEEPKSSSGGHTGLIIGVSVAAVVIAGGVVAAILLTQKSGNSCSTASGTGCLQITASQGIVKW